MNPPYPADNRIPVTKGNRDTYGNRDANTSHVSNSGRNSASYDNRNANVARESRYHDNREVTVTFESRDSPRTKDNRARVQGPLSSSMKPRPVCITV